MGPGGWVEPRPYPGGDRQQSDSQGGDGCLADPAGGGTAVVEDVVGIAVGSSIGDEHRAAEHQTFAATQPQECGSERVEHG